MLEVMRHLVLQETSETSKQQQLLTPPGQTDAAAHPEAAVVAQSTVDDVSDIEEA